MIEIITKRVLDFHYRDDDTHSVDSSTEDCTIRYDIGMLKRYICEGRLNEK